MEKVTLYCDGSSLENPGFGGWCAILRHKDKEITISGAQENTTNNRMELTAVIKAFEKLKKPCDVMIVSDSQYVCRGISEWLENWKARDFKKIKNDDLWRRYVELSKAHNVATTWVRGHNGHAENERCDTIAKNEAAQLKNQKNADSAFAQSVGAKAKTSAAQSVKTATCPQAARLNKNLAPSQNPQNLFSPQNLNPHNPPESAPQARNTRIDEETMYSLNSLQQRIQYEFRDLDLLIEALTHKSFDKKRNNERLEFLGDAVLDLLVGEYVFKKLESSSEGDLTKLRASLVNEMSFSELAQAIELGKYLFISQAEIKNNGRNKPSILSNAFEALIGAVYLDGKKGGLESARIISYRLLEQVFKDIALDSLFKDYKTSLQEVTQAICGVIPEYVLVSSSGPDHDKSFTMSVVINGVKHATASGKSKKEAEQNCAKIAYNHIKTRQQ